MILSDDVVREIKAEYRGSTYTGQTKIFGWLKVFLNCTPQSITVFKNESVFYRWKNNQISSANDAPTIICL